MNLLPVDVARARVLDHFHPLDTIKLPVRDALGHVLAEDVFAPHPLPRFDNSAMDGYALRAVDTDGASSVSPVTLAAVGVIPAGQPGDVRLTAGSAIRIMTGAPLPPGADAVVPIEEVEERDGGVAIRSRLSPGTFVRKHGEDVAEGDLLVARGTEVGAGEAALLAAAGVSPVQVHRRPRVAILVTGDELVPPEASPAPGQIRDSNSVALAALVEEAGGEVTRLGRVRDTLESHRSEFERAAAVADVVVSSGGVAVGDHDLVKAVLEELGSIDLWRVAMQPGKPVVLGRIGTTPVLGLPGNPVSVHVGFEQFVRPAIRKLRGCGELLRPTIEATVTEPLEKPPGRLHFVRVRLAASRDGWRATPTGPQGSHIQSSLVGCHGVARFAPELTQLPAGARVTVEVWRLPPA
ncbi:MAG: molybdopterin molybdotransferase MoeA [Actinomycetota bacterium]|nr:molybdopterin molybdotransferase MoeA [Actinomycetota bacterium]